MSRVKRQPKAGHIVTGLVGRKHNTRPVSNKKLSLQISASPMAQSMLANEKQFVLSPDRSKAKRVKY